MKFRKKPIVIDAVQLTQESFASGAVREFCPNAIPQSGYRVKIPTKEGQMLADTGDWIIKGVAGEFYPCKDSIFIKTYDPVGLDESESDDS